MTQQPTPPRLAVRLITLLVPATRAELVLGDMEEDFADDVRREGHARARRRYWRTALTSIVHGGRWRRIPDVSRSATNRRPGPMELIMEIRLAARALRRRPVYSLVTILTLAIAIGTTVAVLSIVNSVLLRPLPYEKPHELVTIWRTDPSRRADPAYENSWNRMGGGLEQIEALSAASHVFRGAAGFRTERRVVAAAGPPEEHIIGEATPSLFGLLGVRPTLGRVFNATTDDAKSVLLSSALWQRAFNGDARAIGSTIQLNGEPHTVIGVLPASFGIQAQSAFIQSGPPALWVPVGASPGDRERRDLEILARVVDPAAVPVAMQTAQVILNTVEKGSGAAIERRQDSETATLRRPLYLLLTSAAVFLVLACLNVGTLSLAEGEGRQREMWTRVALGGSRTQVARYLLLESALIATAGMLAGVLIAGVAIRPLLAISPIELPGDVGLDLSMLPIVCTVLVTVLFLSGSVPAWVAWRRAARGGMPGASRSHTGTGAVVRHAMIAAQFALATVLLVTSALLTRSLLAESQTPPGFATENRIAIQVRRAPGVGGATRAVIMERLARIPGVASVAVTRRLPLRDDVMGWQMSLPDAAKYEPMIVSLESVSENYFSTMGIPIEAGRGIEARDVQGSDAAVVLSRKLADRLWPGLDPIGRKVADAFLVYTVVGIAADVRDEGLDKPAEGIMYPAIAQTILPGDDAFVLHVTAPAEQVMRQAQDVIRELAPGAAIRDVLRFEDIVADVLAADRYRATLSLIFAILATFLSAIGLAALVLRDVGSRMKEFAIRFSLGASRGHIVRLPIRSALRGVLVGAVLGVAGSLAAGRMLASYLYGVQSGDPLALAVVIPVLAAVMLGTLMAALRRTPERDLVANLNG